jgi:hypothetical protein
MPIIIKEKFKNTNKQKDKVGGGGMDIGKTPEKKKPVKKMMGGANMKMKMKMKMRSSKWQHQIQETSI